MLLSRFTSIERACRFTDKRACKPGAACPSPSRCKTYDVRVWPSASARSRQRWCTGRRVLMSGIQMTTRVVMLDLLKENKQLAGGAQRAVQTSGMVARVGEHRIALYLSGRRHAGENMAELLQKRACGLAPPIQLSDALSANWMGEFARLVAKCLAHARRQFVPVGGRLSRAVWSGAGCFGGSLSPRCADQADDGRGATGLPSGTPR